MTKEEARAWVDRQIAIEQEKITRRRKEAETQRQEEQTAKHDEQKEKILFKMSEAMRTIEHYTPVYEALKTKYDELTVKIKLYEARGLLTGNARLELVKISDKLYAVETKLNKAKFEKELAERKLA